MNDNTFFKPTPLYKEFMILDLIEKNKDITQREISETVGVAVSMVNHYLDEYEKKKYIRRKYRSTKTVEYFVTKKGVERKQLLNIKYLGASLKIYNSAEENIRVFLNNIIEKQVNVSLEDFSKGIYFVKVKSNTQQKVIKLIKE